MDDNPLVPPSGISEADALASLAARVAELEEQVAGLNARLFITRHPLRERSPLILKADVPAPPPLVVWTSDAPVLPDPPLEPAAPQKSLEDRLGSQVFNFIGIVALLFGSAWALKLAIEHGLVGPAARVIIGLAAGVGLVLWSEHFRRKALVAFSYTLKAVGTGILYLSLWAAFQLYHLLPAPVALFAMILVTAWNAFMAFSQDAELLAAYALVGGLLTPLLLSTGGDHETFLFTYIAAIDLCTVALLRSKSWPRLLLPAYAATVIYFIGYYAEFFHRAASYYAPTYAYTWDGQSSETAFFIIVFSALFALVSTKAWETEEPATPGIIVPVLLPLGNAAFVSLALYSVLQDSGLHPALAWLMVALAAAFLALMRLQKTKLAAAMHLAAAIVFLTVAIPLKAHGHTLTTAWLVEGLILFWASIRFDQENTPGNKAPLRVLWLLSAMGYVLGLGSVLFHWTWNWSNYAPPLFFNANLGSALAAAVAFAAAAWLSVRDVEPATEASFQFPVALCALSAIDLIAFLLNLREIAPTFDTEAVLHPAFASADFATALVGLGLLAATTWAAWRITASTVHPERKHLYTLTAAVDLVLFNFVAILIVEREIGALWTRHEAGLQRSLAISGFLMVYAAILLAAGFWWRNAFVRWQALILILFTIAKVFLYDISGLSAGYRVASFFALGALLLTVSFAYQKDWLGLKDSPVDGESA